MSSAAVKRLQSEARDFARDAPPLIDACPSEDNLFVWLFVLNGAPGTPYEHGEYVGRMTFPEDYPFRPPKIEMLTPSGRFITNMRLCLSISDYHPESWSPAWTVGTILVGVLSFMSDSAQTAGSMISTDDDKRRLAKLSHGFNLALPGFATHFPDRAGEQVVLPSRSAGHNTAVSPPTVSQAMSPTNDAVAEAMAEYAMDDDYYFDYTEVGGDDEDDDEEDDEE